MMKRRRREKGDDKVLYSMFSIIVGLLAQDKKKHFKILHYNVGPCRPIEETVDNL